MAVLYLNLLYMRHVVKTALYLSCLINDEPEHDLFLAPGIWTSETLPWDRNAYLTQAVML